MSSCTNEPLEYCIIYDNYQPTKEQIKEMARELLELRSKIRGLMRGRLE